ncbi:MAG: T9SS type A sorting domain-containing protein, partial [Bacteroidota bacterium]|nr:T9SS type A sorting domain-containing protein [Bacteroidota bacterium]MDX5429582.1 T9SS type A sorting domain-containing protein [Bacteroidota bacterium]MDX5468366.1 T9SS type A sorting domain-containing protein [Bacteroidota bacterium]
ERYQNIPHVVTIRPDTAADRKLFTNLTTKAMIRLVSCENVSIDGSYNGEGAYLIFEMQANSGGTLLQLSRNPNWPFNNAYNTIKNCRFTTSTANTTVKGIQLGFNPQPDNMHDIDISGNYFYNLGTGIDVYGNYGSLIKIRDIRIAHNKFGHFEYGGVMRSFPLKVVEAMDVEIFGNEFNEIYSPMTIWIGAGVTRTQVLNNRIQNFGVNQLEASAIHITTAEKFSELLVANNFIWGMQSKGYLGNPSGRSSGINILKSGTTITGGVSIIHNTIHLDGSVNVPSIYKTAAIYSDDPFQLKIVNNVLSNIRKNEGTGSSQQFVVQIGSYWDTGIHTLDYNVMHVDSGGYYLNLKNTNYTNLSSLKQDFSGDFDHNAACDPIFYSSTDLRAVSGCIPQAGSAQGISEDIFNNPRSLTTPSIGAYEFIEYSNDLALISFRSLNTCASDSIVFEVVVLNTGSDSVSNYQFKLSVDGNPPFTYTIPSTATHYPKERDTLIFHLKFANKVSDLDLELSLNSFFDLDTTNNFLSYQMRLHPLPELQIMSDTVCRGSQAMLTANASIPSAIFWYLDSAQNNYYNQGASLWSVTVWDTLTYYAQALDTVNGCWSDIQRVDVLPLNYNILDLGPDLEVCSRDSAILMPTYPYQAYLWSTNDTSSSIFAKSTGTITLIVLDSLNCTQHDTVEVFVSDCVWPGDANNDGIANAVDLLHLAISFKQTGTTRPNASLQWQGQFSADWGNILLGMPDRKHADTDGDGIIDFSDTNAILLNYGLVHLKKGGAIEGQEGDVPVYFRFSSDTSYDGEWVSADLMVSDSSTPISMYGLAFSLDGIQGVKAGSMQFRPSDSWFISSTEDYLGLSKYMSDSVQLDIALARTDVQNRSGGGKIGEIRFQLDQPGVPLNLTLLPYKLHLIDKSGAIIPTFNLPLDTMAVLKEPLLNGGLETPVTSWRIYPNPTRDKVILDLDGQKMNHLKVLDIQGKIISTLFEETGMGYQVNLKDIPSGLYLITFEVNGARHQFKIIKE